MGRHREQQSLLSYRQHTLNARPCSARSPTIAHSSVAYGASHSEQPKIYLCSVHGTCTYSFGSN